ncbi:MAG: CHASE2 domain-containing protein [Cyanobacteria bacterium P01_B01_bin.77]
MGVSSLSDRALDQLRRKLETSQPRVIGLDIYREQAVNPVYSQLARWMGANDRFFAICNCGNPGVPQLPVPLERHGFNNVLEDSDGVWS